MMEMSEVPDNHELDKRLAVLEERMNTIQANLDKTLQEFKTDMANFKIDAEKRDKTLLITLIALFGVSVTILGLWLG